MKKMHKTGKIRGGGGREKRNRIGVKVCVGSLADGEDLGSSS